MNYLSIKKVEMLYSNRAGHEGCCERFIKKSTRYKIVPNILSYNFNFFGKKINNNNNSSILDTLAT